MKKKSILILSATAGAGHVRAAEALVETAKALSLPVETRHEDILKYTFPVFRKIYSDIQYAVVNKSPELWGYLYRKSEFTGTPKPAPPLIKLFNHFNYKKYHRLLRDTAPDAVLCTHFLPYAALDKELNTSFRDIPFFAVTTDYDVHSLWINPAVRHYYVGTEETAWTLTSHGISKDAISVTGIPVMPQFGKRTTQRTARLQLGLSTNSFTIMILSGGYTTGIIEEVLSSISKTLSSYRKKEFQVIIVCGKNARLYEKLKRMKPPDTVRHYLYRHVSFIDQLMDCADILITKSGGLTVSEALAKQLPMIIFDPVPGQEGRNAMYLLEHGAALSAGSLSNLEFKLKQLIEDRTLLDTMKTNAGRIAKPDAAKKILEDVMNRI